MRMLLTALGVLMLLCGPAIRCARAGDYPLAGGQLHGRGQRLGLARRAAGAGRAAADLGGEPAAMMKGPTMRRISIGFAALVAASCTSGPSGGAPLQGVSLEAGPCYGTCPVYSARVNSDGSGRFEGRQHTAVSGTREFSISPAQYQHIVQHLAPLRPARGDARYDRAPPCESMSTDMPSIDVVWHTAEGDQRFHYNYGCRISDSRSFNEHFDRAYRLLPINAWVAGEGQRAAPDGDAGNASGAAN